MKRLLRLWKVLTWAAGEGDYARYCDYLRARHPGHKTPTEKEFYLSRLRERYSRPHRCC
jgi:uncharacterized short protein YbdD (DUF466 family)